MALLIGDLEIPLHELPNRDALTRHDNVAQELDFKSMMPAAAASSFAFTMRDNERHWARHACS